LRILPSPPTPAKICVANAVVLSIATPTVN